MKTIKNTILKWATALVVMVASSTALLAQNKYNKFESSYNYQKGIEAVQNDDYLGCYESMSKEISVHPDNGYAYMYLGIVCNLYEDYGEATSAINMALSLISKKDKDNVSFCYNLRGDINYALGMYDDALADYTKAIKLCPKDASYLYDRAQFFYYRELYDESSADYTSILKLDENDVRATAGIGRNMIAKGDYENAVTTFDYVIARYPDYSYAFSCRAWAYAGLKDYTNMASDVVRALEIDHNQVAFTVLLSNAVDGFTQLVARLKAKTISEPNNSKWPLYLGLINQINEKYDVAAEDFAKSARIDPTPFAYSCLASCYDKMGDYSKAMDAIDLALSLDSEDSSYLNDKANIYWYLGDLDNAIMQQTKAIEAEPESGYPYHRRGWFKSLNEDFEGAIDDYTMALALDPDNVYTYYIRGVAYKKMNEHEKAKTDFITCIQKDTLLNGNSCAEFAYFHLGENAKAIEFMDNLLKKDRNANLYDAACLYSLMGHKERAISYLQEAIKSGAFKNYRHMAKDSDLDNIRDTEAYKELEQQYLPDNSNGADVEGVEVSYTTKVTEIPFTRANGVTKVQCTINGLPLQFVFDTGASSVSISSLEATFMYKNDLLSKKDIVGSASFIDANGYISVGTMINLRNVSFAGFELENVKASVVSNDKAPLLLGQSVLSRLGKVEIDYEKNVIRITAKVKE